MSVIAAELGEPSSDQAPGMFMTGNGLPRRWQGRTRFVILQTGFGRAGAFLATWAAWLADPQRCNRLIFIATEARPLAQADLAQILGDLGENTAPGAQALLSRRLLKAWPTQTPGLHTLHFDEPLNHAGQLQGVTLMLGLGEIGDLLPALLASVDAFYLDGLAANEALPKWAQGLLPRLNRLAAPQATAAFFSPTQAVNEALSKAGFEVAPSEGMDAPVGWMSARYAPHYMAPPSPGGLWPQADPAQRHAIVLGAGLAGASAAWALCRQGWRVTLIDQHEGPAQEGSGNPGGLFHSVLHGDDGIHARAHRAAALATWAQVRPLILSGQLAGQCDGLLRLDHKMTRDDAQALLQRLSLPPDHVTWLDQDEAVAASGLQVASGGWLFRQGGWLHPAGYARCLLHEASAWRHQGHALLSCLWQRPIARIQQTPDGVWQVLDASGACVAQAPSLVLANAHQAGRLLNTLPPAQAVAPLPLSRVRGQISALHQASPDFHQVTLPRLPVAGSGYALPLNRQDLLCGATTQHHDEDPAVRHTDHLHNLRQAQRLGAWQGATEDGPLPAGLTGRTGWRAITPDRLPLVGALPWSHERLTDRGRRQRLDQVRLIPRERQAQGGLYVLSGLGSRGITWAALAGELLAHWVTGAPCPVEVDLRDALDPARFLSRAYRT